MDKLEAAFIRFELNLRDKKSGTGLRYSDPVTKLRFALLPITTSGGESIWFDNYVEITMRWFGSKSDGTSYLTLSLDEHGEWLSRQLRAEKPTENNVISFNRVKLVDKE